MIAEMVMAWLYGGRAIARRWDLGHWRLHRREAALLDVEVVES